MGVFPNPYTNLNLLWYCKRDIPHMNPSSVTWEESDGEQLYTLCVFFPLHLTSLSFRNGSCWGKLQVSFRAKPFSNGKKMLIIIWNEPSFLMISKERKVLAQRQMSVRLVEQKQPEASGAHHLLKEQYRQFWQSILHYPARFYWRHFVLTINTLMTFTNYLEQIWWEVMLKETLSATSLLSLRGQFTNG